MQLHLDHPLGVGAGSKYMSGSNFMSLAAGGYSPPSGSPLPGGRVVVQVSLQAKRGSRLKIHERLTIHELGIIRMCFRIMLGKMHDFLTGRQNPGHLWYSRQRYALFFFYSYFA